MGSLLTSQYRCFRLWLPRRHHRQEMGFQLDLFDHLHLRFSNCKFSIHYVYQAITDAQAAPKYNWEAVCGLYFLSCIGLGGNIPIDALIALEFLPQNRRNLVSLLSLWQPVGVVAASGIAYGTVAKYRCNPDLPSCQAVAAGEACCAVSDNFGWRVLLGVLGGVTLLVFFARFVVFNFHESPKFLLSKGRSAEAIEVLHKIAKFNRQPPPTLTLEHFRAIDIDAGIDTEEIEQQRALTWKESTIRAWANFKDSIFKLKGLFGNRLQAFIFVLLAITYMVGLLPSDSSYVQG